MLPPKPIREGRCVAYELQGSYSFSDRASDEAVIDALRSRVRRFVDDAPALESTINPGAPVIATDLGVLYRQASPGGAESLKPLVLCGRNLLRCAVLQLAFGTRRGKLIISQLLTTGRLAPGFEHPGLYGVRYDPAAAQFVLNLMAEGTGALG